jgi:hypothetical protein
MEEYQGITIIKRDFDAFYDEEIIYQQIPIKKPKRRKTIIFDDSFKIPTIIEVVFD